MAAIEIIARNCVANLGKAKLTWEVD